LLALALAAQPLTLEEAQRQAIAHQPALQAALHRTEGSEARLKQARAVEYPQVSAAAELMGATANNTATSYLTPADFPRVGTRPAAEASLSDLTPFADSILGVGAHYNLLDFGYTRGTVGAAEASRDAAKASAQQSAQDVLYRVAVAYLGALAAEQSLVVAQDAKRRADEHDALARAGVKSGFKPPIDLARSGADVASAQLGVIRAQNAVRVAHAQLDAEIGWVPPAEYALAPPAPDARAVPEIPDAEQAAWSTRFDLLSVRAQERAAEQQRVAARSGGLPRLLATSSVSLRGFDGLPSTVNWDVGLVLTAPLFTGFHVQGEEEEAESRRAELASQEAVLRAQIGLQLRQARETLLSAREAITASEAQVSAAQAGLSLAEGRYKQGLGNIVELADAQAQFDAAQLGLVQSRLAAAVSRVQLDHAAGAMAVP
jgi:outer membrane protein TolC